MAHKIQVLENQKANYLLLQVIQKNNKSNVNNDFISIYLPQNVLVVVRKMYW